jgi:hypothetical protein
MSSGSPTGKSALSTRLPPAFRSWDTGQDELEGASGLDLVHPDDLADAKEAFGEVLKKEKPGCPPSSGFGTPTGIGFESKRSGKTCSITQTSRALS